MKRAAIVLILVVAVGAAVWWVAKKEPFGKRRDEAFTILCKAVPPRAQLVFQAARVNHKVYRTNVGLWSLAYFGCTFGAALLSAFSGVILKLDVLAKSHEGLRRDLAAIFASAAALLITLSTLGNFEDKWRANRLAASNMEAVLYRLATPGAEADVPAILAEMREINRAQDQAIVAPRGSTSP